MLFKNIIGNREGFLEFLLIADPDENVVNEYLNEGTLISMEKDNKCVGVALFREITEQEVEIVNIGIIPSIRAKGNGSKLLQHTIRHIKEKGYDSVIVGTGNSSIKNIEFYQKNGFDLFELWGNYFLEKYTTDIYEDGIQCKHMLRFKMGLS